MSEKQPEQGNDKPQVPPENMAGPAKSFVTPEEAKAATRPTAPTSEEEKAKEEMEHPYVVLVRLVNTLCVLTEQQNKKSDALIERFDKFFSLFEALAKPKSPAPVTVPSPSAVPTPASAPAPSLSPAPAPTSAPAPQTVSQDVANKIAKIKAQLGPELVQLLIFDTDSSSNLVLVKTTGYLDADKFAKIAAVLREFGGQYVSAGKASHFQIPKFEAKK